MRQTKTPTAHADDTIVAVITPPGEGGIAALRIAGPKALPILNRLFRPERKASQAKPFFMRYGRMVTVSGESLDEVLAVFMPKGHSYTGLDQVEIFCHGGRMIAQEIMAEILKAGARAAGPGEFTQLAFLNGRIDLARAEAVAEMIAANTEQSCRVAREHLLGPYSEAIEHLRDRLVGVMAEIEADIDFGDEEHLRGDNASVRQTIDDIDHEVRQLIDSFTGGRIIREGFRLALAGRPNAGKSSLFNLLLKQERALVAPTPGTTRDYLSEWIDLGGFAVNLMDTAGLRRKGGAVEQAGQKRAETILQESDLVLWLFDISQPNWQEQLTDDCKRLRHTNIITVGNKVDLVAEAPSEGAYSCLISCLTGQGIDSLKKKLIDEIRAGMPDLTSGSVVTSARHQQQLKAAHLALRRARSKLADNESPEIIAFELQQATRALDEITGRIYNEEILGRIFSSFCIGK